MLSGTGRHPLRVVVTLAVVAAGLALAPAGSTAGASSTPGHGVLRVTVTPDVATQVHVAGQARNTGRVAALDLPADDHTVCFDAVAGYLPPACESVTIEAGRTTVLDKHFVRAGTLEVTTEPSLAAPIVVDGVVRDHGTVTIPVEVGEHTVCYGSIPGWTAPRCDSVHVTASATTTTVGSYTQAGEPPPEPEPTPKDPTPKPEPPPTEPPSSTPKQGTATGCRPVVGDWDGRGRDGVGWWCDGQVRLRSADGKLFEYRYGRAGDVPISADWNGDGRDTISVIRDGVWHLNNRLGGGSADRTFVYGRVSRGDVPVAGSWKGGPRDLPGIIRDRQWHLRSHQSGGNANTMFVYGRLTGGDHPLWGDWNGDGRDTAGIVRSGTWHLRNSNSAGPGDVRFVYGRVLTGDAPVVGDWNGDGRDTPGIVRDGVWHLRTQNRPGPADLRIGLPTP